MKDKRVLDYIGMEKVWDKIRVWETLEYYAQDDYTIDEIKQYIKNIEELIK